MMKKASLFILLILFGLVTQAQIGTVDTFSKISDIEGNFIGILSDHDNFGTPCYYW